MNFVDPTVVFTAAVVLLPLVFVTDTASAIAYLTHPTMLAALAVTAALVLFAGPGAALAPHERRLAYWFLCNGVFYNFFLDVVAGQAQSFGLMTAQYNRVEPRYALGYLSDAGAPVFMTSALEALFQAPLGIFAFVAIRRGWPQRHAAALALSILHAAGVWYFYVPEVLNGFAHLGGWPKTAAEALSLERVLYFWFGFWFCGALWLVVPACIARYACAEISAGVAAADAAARKRA